MEELRLYVQGPIDVVAEGSIGCQRGGVRMKTKSRMIEWIGLQHKIFIILADICVVCYWVAGPTPTIKNRQLGKNKGCNKQHKIN